MEQLKLNMIPNGVNTVFHASQYDKGRQIGFVLDETLSGAEVTTSYRAKDGTEYGNVQTSVSGNTITDTIPEEVLTDYGIIEGEVDIDGIGSLNFFVEVEKDAYDGGVITTQTASGAIATFETNIETAFVSLKSDINPVQDLHGYTKPWSGGGGKNKFNDTTGTHTINANTDTTITIGDVYLEANTTYTISCKQTPAPLTSFVRNTLSVVGGGTTTYNPAGNDYTIKPMVFTPTVSGTYSIRVWGHTLSANTTYSQFQVEVGSTATAYEPYSNICPISGFSALNVTRTGVNLWDEQWEQGSIDSITGLNELSSLHWRTNYIKISPTTRYYIVSATAENKSLRARFYDENKNYIGYSAKSGSTYTDSSFVSPDNAYYVRFAPFASDIPNHDLSLNYPSTDTEYHAYNGQTASVNFGQTVYGGVADVTNGKLTITHVIKNIGANDISDNGTSGGLIELYVNGTSNKKNGQTNMLCNNLEVRANASAYAIRGRAGSSNVTFCLPTSDVPDFNSAKTWVTNNPIELVYELATPIEITTTPENLTAIAGQNNVYSDTNGDTTVEYYIEV